MTLRLNPVQSNATKKHPILKTVCISKVYSRSPKLTHFMSKYFLENVSVFGLRLYKDGSWWHLTVPTDSDSPTNQLGLANN